MTSSLLPDIAIAVLHIKQSICSEPEQVSAPEQPKWPSDVNFYRPPAVLAKNVMAQCQCRFFFLPVFILSVFKWAITFSPQIDLWNHFFVNHNRRGTRCTGRGVGGGGGGFRSPRMGGKYSGPIIARRSVHKHFIDAAAVNGQPKNISIGNILQVDTMPDVSHLRWFTLNLWDTDKMYLYFFYNNNILLSLTQLKVWSRNNCMWSRTRQLSRTCSWNLLE